MAAGRGDVGPPGRRPTRGALFRRCQPRSRLRGRRRDAGVRRPSATPGASLLLDRRACTPGPAAVGPSRAALGTRARSAPDSTVVGHRRGPARTGRPARPACPARRGRRAAPREHRHVHRGGRRVPGRRRRRCALSGACERVGAPRPVVRPHRGQADHLQGGGRCRDDSGLPDVTSNNDEQAAAPSWTSAARPSPRWSASTSTTSTSRRGALTNGSASARSIRSCPCCSDNDPVAAGDQHCRPSLVRLDSA